MKVQWQVKAKSVVSAVLAKGLIDYGGGLELATLKSTSDTLFKYGTNEDAAADAARAALESHIEYITDMLSEIGSMDELDSYERELTSLMRDYGVYSSRATNRIDSRREELFEEEHRHYEDEYGGHSRMTSRADISDDDIRSMFSGLKPN